MTQYYIPEYIEETVNEIAHLIADYYNPMKTDKKMILDHIHDCAAEFV